MVKLLFLNNASLYIIYFLRMLGVARFETFGQWLFCF